MTSNPDSSRSPGAHCAAIPPYGAPRIAPSAWIAPGAIVVGNVTIGSESSIWYNAVVRGDSNAVRIGARTNVQDGVVLHTMRGPEGTGSLTIGDDVSIGHNAVVHGATIEDGCLIGMNATVLSGAIVGAGSLVAAGALVPEGMRVPPGSLIVGVPGRIVRELGDADRAAVADNSAAYAAYTDAHRAATRGAGSAR